MDKQDYWNAQSRLQAAIHHAALKREPRLVINSETGQQYVKGDDEDVSRLYDRVVSKLDALTAAIDTWD